MRSLRAAGRQNLIAQFKHAAKFTPARIVDVSRSRLRFVAGVARAAMHTISRPNFSPVIRQVPAAMKDITRRRGKIRDGFGDIDPSAAGRAAAAAAAIAARYAGLIEEISKNPGLSPEQRAAAIAGLRMRQAAESAAASRAIMEDAKNAARARRRMKMDRG